LVKSKLIAPQAGEPKTIFDAGYGRGMVERSFFYPNNREEIYRIWWYFKGNPVLIFPLTENNEVVALCQFRHGANDFVIELPGGLPNQKTEESPLRVVERELLEETGYESETSIYLGYEPWTDAASINLRFIPFIGLNCKKVQEPNLDKGEEGNIEVILVPIKKWYKMIWAGEILESKTIAHSLLVMPHLLKHQIQFI
jgi:ADP-ribose pyrophosphatase